MHRIYCSPRSICVDKITVSDKQQVHHFKNVLRLKSKDKVITFDNRGTEYIAEIEKITPNSIILNIIKDRRQFSPGKNLCISLACAIPKKSKMDDIVDKLTQLGVDRIIPLETKRVVVKWDKHKKILQQKRWEKIALNASQQSKRRILPVIEPVKQLKEVLFNLQKYDLKIMPTLAGRRVFLGEALREHKPKNILVILGPEGDFTLQEVSLAKKEGFIPVSLGDLVLRTETAAVAIASFLYLKYI